MYKTMNEWMNGEIEIKILFSTEDETHKITTTYSSIGCIWNIFKYMFYNK